MSAVDPDHILNRAQIGSKDGTFDRPGDVRGGLLYVEDYWLFFGWFKVRRISRHLAAVLPRDRDADEPSPILGLQLWSGRFVKIPSVNNHRCLREQHLRSPPSVVVRLSRRLRIRDVVIDHLRACLLIASHNKKPSTVPRRDGFT